MGNIGPLELAVVVIIALVVLGPKRLPEVGRSVGKGMREFKDAISGGGDDDHKFDFGHDSSDDHQEQAQLTASDEKPPVGATEEKQPVAVNPPVADKPVQTEVASAEPSDKQTPAA